MVVSQLSRMLAAAALAGAVACSHARSEPFALVGMEEVEKMLGAPDVLVVDANPKEVFERNHLPGARWWRSAPLAQLLPAEKDRRIVFYCAAPS